MSQLDRSPGLPEHQIGSEKQVTVESSSKFVLEELDRDTLSKLSIHSNYPGTDSEKKNFVLKGSDFLSAYETRTDGETVHLYRMSPREKDGSGDVIIFSNKTIDSIDELKTSINNLSQQKRNRIPLTYQQKTGNLVLCIDGVIDTSQVH